MQIKVDEITKILRQQIEGYDRGTDLAEVGTILSVGDGITPQGRRGTGRRSGGR